MERTRRSLTYSLAILMGAAVACGGSDPTPPNNGDPTDSGTDSGIVDSGTPDSGIVDSGTPDSGIVDSGTPDSGTPDSGTPDSGTPDSGTPDSGTPDSGTPDAGTPDAGTDGGTVVALVCTTCHSTGLSAAHAVHTAGGIASGAFPCSECHTLYTSMSHASGAAVVTFATAAGDIAKTGGLTPLWTPATTTCSSVYCHGGGTTISGGKVTSPDWNKTDGTQDNCDSCHGNPPAANANNNNHVQCTKDFCNVCHLDAYPGGGIDASTKLHVNGFVDVMPTADWGKSEHGKDKSPPGHPGVDLTTCVVCHGPTPAGIPSAKQEAMTCLTCHDPIPG